MTMRLALTKRRLQAIQEALTNSLAGPLQGDRKDYEAALAWADWQLGKRSKPSVDGKPRT